MIRCLSLLLFVVIAWFWASSALQERPYPTNSKSETSRIIVFSQSKPELEGPRDNPLMSEKQSFPSEPVENHSETTPSSNSQFKPLSQYAVIVDEQILGDFEQLLGDKQSKYSLSRLSAIARFCSKLPADEAALEKEKRALEQRLMENYQNNGQIMQAQTRLSNLYQRCQDIAQDINDPVLLDFAAAEQGDTFTMVQLATQTLEMESPELSATDGELSMVKVAKLNNGEILEYARSQCEFQAFQVLAYPHNNGYQKAWLYPNETLPDDVQAYANLLAGQLLLTRHFGAGHPASEIQNSEIALREQSLTTDAIDKGRQLAHQLFRDGCIT